MSHTDSVKQKGDNQHRWYVIYTNSGYEKAVAKNLKQRINSMGMQDYIFDVLVPTEKVIKIKKGKKVEEEVTIYPGYVMVDMIVNDKSWWVVRNTQRVNGFLGTGIHPVPVSDKEMLEVIEKVKGGKEKHSLKLQIGDVVKITDGPFKGVDGKIMNIDEITGEVTLKVSMFGQDTEVILDIVQIKAI